MRAIILVAFMGALLTIETNEASATDRWGFCHRDYAGIGTGQFCTFCLTKARIIAFRRHNSSATHVTTFTMRARA
jgi:hypothetical protein